VAAGADRIRCGAAAFDLKAFFEVARKDPVEVTAADVFDFLADQRGDRMVARWRAGSPARRRGRLPAAYRRCRACWGDPPVRVNPFPPSHRVILRIAQINRVGWS
jgi:hypothetical protein